uniref:Ig-like domain-containing protein n=1 Tax=Acinetobacter sp. MB5 TaxID=2069438 RepID=UPI0013A708AC
MANTIQIISKESHKVLETINSNHVSVTQNSVVVVDVRQQDVATITRDGNSAVITLKNGDQIVIQNFYNTNTPDNSLVFRDDNHELLVIEHSATSEVSYLPIESIDPLLYTDSANAVAGAAGLSAWGIGAGLAAGVVAAAASGGSSSGSSGVKDTTAPDAPTVNVTANNNGTLTVTGQAEAGSTVTVTFPDGTKANVIAASDGSYTATSGTPQTSGDVSATATDHAGNTSDPTTVSYTDTTAPEAPSIDQVTANDDGTVTVSGQAEAGSTVTVTFPDGTTASIVAGSDGSYSLTSGSPQTSGDVSATATDHAGNTSDPTTVVYTDVTAPLVSIDELTPNDDGTLTVSGQSEVGSTVTVTFPDGSTKNVVVASDGSYSVTSDMPQTSGDISAIAKDAAGNTSNPATTTYTDTTPPEAPTIDQVISNDDGTVTVGGQSEVGTTVTVTFPDGTTQDVLTASDGSYTATSVTVQDSGTIVAIAVDQAGNYSSPTSTDYVDTVDSTSESLSESTSLSESASESLSESLSASESESASASESLSESLSASESASLSASESVSESLSASESASLSASESVSESLSASE